ICSCRLTFFRRARTVKAVRVSACARRRGRVTRTDKVRSRRMALGIRRHLVRLAASVRDPSLDGMRRPAYQMTNANRSRNCFVVEQAPNMAGGAAEEVGNALDVKQSLSHSSTIKHSAHVLIEFPN